MGNLVLASTSRYRRALMERLGLPFRCLAPLADEDGLKQGEWTPHELAEQLALAKARSLALAEPEATIIGGDQLVSFEGRIYGKPGTFEAAVGQLETMSGSSHLLITALAVWHQGEAAMHTDTTTMHMRRLSRAEIERYVAADRPVDCAGSYKLEERGITLFERVETEDYTSILGMPLIALTTMLRRIGHAVP